MTNGQRTITSLLAVVAVLLGLNLILGSSRRAEAQDAIGAGEPYIVKLLPVSHLTYHRVWSDGRVDTMQRTDGNCDYESNLTHGPVEHPFPVVDAVLGSNHDSQSAMLTFEDGRVDLMVESQCWSLTPGST